MKFFTIFLFILFSNFPVYAKKNNNAGSNKFKTECRLLEAEISLLLYNICFVKVDTFSITKPILLINNNYFDLKNINSDFLLTLELNAI